MKDYKVIFHIDEMTKWKLLLTNVSNLLKASGEDNYFVEVLANAEAVKYYDQNQHALDFDNDVKIMESLNQQGVKFAACHNALVANNLKKDNLYDYVETVPAGVIELVVKQNEGYCYIKP
ncbi:DsrE/DsrF-like family protein [Desulfosporosinus acididurans]|uniref:DsrE/DsrF-like family protein n=1 Tax=Desulfosporosinus acididurans TaxID=476652 RepID=A0A0J1FXA1_9FIRM|nr:DsrE family protein [Desulfosporosinus acididurans]KLU67643.1 DsrE/DsrF-like family protein [Desulfosporosinus acididurans]